MVRSSAAFLAFCLALAFTLILALIPHPPNTPFAQDKVQHMLAFAALSLLLSAAYENLAFGWRFAALAGLGGLIELLQLIPLVHRDGELADWLADCVATLIVLVLYDLASRLWTGRSRPGS